MSVKSTWNFLRRAEGSKKQLVRDGKEAFHLLKAASVFWVVAFVCAALLTANIYRKLITASVATSDTVEFTLAQVELELFHLIDALRQVEDRRSSSLDTVRLAFDIFYSRVTIIAEGSAYEGALNHANFKASLLAAQDFLREYETAVDDTDEKLNEILPAFLGAAEKLREPLRALVLEGLAHFTEDADSERRAVNNALAGLAVLVLLLFLTLTIFLLALLRALKSARTAAQASKRIASRLDKILSTSLGAIIVSDRQGRIIQVNAVAERTFGYPASEMVGELIATLIVPEEHRRAHNEGMDRVAREKSYRMVGRGAVETEALHKDGRVFPVEISLDVATDGEGEFYVAYLQDISDRVEKQKQLGTRQEALIREAYWDRLTGAMRRTRMQELYAVAGRRTDYYFAVFDIDDFKSINTSYGHAAGDSVLSQISATIAAAIPEAEAFCRYGGEEFVALIPFDAVDGNPADLFDRVLKTVRDSTLNFGVESLRCTVTVGFAILRTDGNLSLTAEQADTALRYAKSIGKDCAVEASPKLLEELGYTANPPSRAMVLEALKAGRIFYYLQPIMDLKSSKVVGYEALLRWIEADGRPVPLPSFLSLFTSIARDPLVLPWLQNMLKRSLPTSDELNTIGAYVSFNYEAYDLLFDFERNALTAALRELVSAGYRVCIEMLESSQGRVVSEERISFLLSRLRDFGFELFLDDFGKEAASLDRLGNFDFSCIKLDRSLVSGLETSEKKRRIIQFAVQLAEHSKVKIVAEGIESDVELKILESLGVKYGQGYLLGRPGPMSIFFS